MSKTFRRIVLIELAVPLTFLVFGIYHGLMQVLYRAGFVKAASFLGIEYYQGLTAHGVINTILLTTFFAVAFGNTLIHQTLGRVPVKGALLSMGLLVLGASLTLAAILSGQASVLYTFYPPLKASPVFYFGLTFFVSGSWVAFWSWLSVYLPWRRKNPGQKVPLAALGILVTFTMWQIATIPVAVEIIGLLIPWSLGWVDRVDVVLARTLFWFFGHPLVYFWLLPAYVMYYTVLPKVAGGKLFSDFAGRFAFLMFLVFSAPLGLHHQFSDPGISSNWKALHTVLTSIVSIPSMLTAFTIAASLEIASRLRGGGGLFAWWKKLPYFDSERWLFPYFMCGLLIFIFGGATGVVNASYNVNQVVHNTSWVPAHFHMTVAGPVFLAILGMSLYIIIGLSGRSLAAPRGALSVPYLWMAGVLLLSSGLFIGGLRGEPRRTNMGMTYLNPEAPEFRADWVVSTSLAAIGGVVMTLAVVVFFYVLVRSLLTKPSEVRAESFAIPLAEPFHDERVPLVRNIGPWAAAAVALCVAAYLPPLTEILRDRNAGAPRFLPSSPMPELVDEK